MGFLREKRSLVPCALIALHQFLEFTGWFIKLYSSLRLVCTTSRANSKVSVRENCVLAGVTVHTYYSDKSSEAALPHTSQCHTSTPTRACAPLFPPDPQTTIAYRPKGASANADSCELTGAARPPHGRPHMMARDVTTVTLAA